MELLFMSFDRTGVHPGTKGHGEDVLADARRPEPSPASQTTGRAGRPHRGWAAGTPRSEPDARPPGARPCLRTAPGKLAEPARQLADVDDRQAVPEPGELAEPRMEPRRYVTAAASCPTPTQLRNPPPADTPPGQTARLSRSSSAASRV
jgi:hypothetical protein